MTSNSSFAETEAMEESDANDPAAAAQGLKGLLYHIAEQDAKRKAYEHRGFGCEVCGEFPIKGIRWHCINCPDFDLCSTCEADNVHPRTHLFVKIRIPMHPLSQSAKEVPCWYPGYPKKTYPSLEPGLSKDLSQEFECSVPRIDAMYDQFLSCANVTWRDDDCDIGVGIDPRAFRQALSSPRWPNRWQPNELYDRMFDFYDTNHDEIIGFKEFLSGQAYLRGPKRFASLDRALRGFDIDDDGYLDRQDFYRLMKAKQELHRTKIDDMISMEEGDETLNAMPTLRSGQPISSVFSAHDIPPGFDRNPSGKSRDVFGDMQPDEGNDQTIFSNDITVNFDLNAHLQARPQNPNLSPEQVQLQARFDNFENIIDAVQSAASGNAASAEAAVPASDGAGATTSSNEPAQGLFRSPGFGDSSQASHQAPTTLDGLAENQDEPGNSGHQQGGPYASVGDSAGATGFPNLPAGVLSDATSEISGPLDRDILWQIAMEGLDYVLDPFFKPREAEDDEVILTRDERERWDDEIEAAAVKRQARLQKLQSSSDIDALMATAAGSQHIDENSAPEGSAKNKPALQPEIVPTDDESLGQLETGIQKSSLDELLSSTGYSIIGLEGTGDENGSRKEESGNDQGGMSGSQQQEAGDGNNDEQQCPSQERLEQLAKLNEVDSRLLERGGPGRLSFQEIKDHIHSKRELGGDLRGLVTGWLEWAAF